MSVPASRRNSLAALGDMLHAFDEVIALVPEARKKALEAAGEVVRKELERQIVAQLPNKDKHGRVRSWQEVTMGTKGGYIKVAPGPSGEYSYNNYDVHDITFWLEHGHEVAKKGRNQYGKLKRYKSKKKIYNQKTRRPIVEGKLFYSWTMLQARKAALNAAEDVLRAITNDLEKFTPGQEFMEGWL